MVLRHILFILYISVYYHAIYPYTIMLYILYWENPIMIKFSMTIPDLVCYPHGYYCGSPCVYECVDDPFGPCEKACQGP